MSTRSITVRIPNDLYEYIAKRAEKEHRTISNMIISMLIDSQFVPNAVYKAEETDNAPQSRSVTFGRIGRNGKIIDTFEEDT